MTREQKRAINALLRPIALHSHLFNPYILQVVNYSAESRKQNRCNPFSAFKLRRLGRGNP